MKIEHANNYMLGVSSATGAYLLWGVLPIYWKLVHDVPAHEVLAHRIIWSFFFMVCVLFLSKRLRLFIDELRQILSQPQKLLGLIMSSLLISANWVTYIWAVNNNRVIETSLGYYINPLASVLLGIIVLKEKLSFWQTFSFFLSLIGVLNMTFHLGGVPWVALFLAASFSLYGLFKKIVNVGALTSITLETLIVSPLAFIYIIYVQEQGFGAFNLNSLGHSGLLMGTGIVTAIPLILFSSGANHLPLTILGFLQYLSPTIALGLGVFLYREPFTTVHLISFGFIWLALIIFSLSRTRLFCQVEALLFKNVLQYLK